MNPTAASLQQNADPARLRAQVARMIDHTQLRAYATEIDIRELCDEALTYGFAAVTVNGAWASFCARQLAGSDVAVDVCVGFPLGATTAHMKVEEARMAMKHGGTEIDMVINIGALKSGYNDYVEKEIAAVVNAVRGIPVKVILETSFLNEDEKRAVCRMAVRANAAYVKTSTGYGNGGATVDDIRLMKQEVDDHCGIKAAGGIRKYGDVLKFVEAGATRIGTSAALDILDDIG